MKLLAKDQKTLPKTDLLVVFGVEGKAPKLPTGVKVPALAREAFRGEFRETRLTELDIEDERHLFRVVLAKDDVGRVIGRQGGTIRAIRSLLEAACIKQKVRASVEVGTREEFGLAPLESGS